MLILKILLNFFENKELNNLLNRKTNTIDTPNMLLNKVKGTGEIEKKKNKNKNKKKQSTTFTSTSFIVIDLVYMTFTLEPFS